MVDKGGPDCCSVNTFSRREAEADLRTYERAGVTGATKALIDAIRAQGIAGASLLDVGGGIGAIQLELLASGLGSAQSVDATAAYVEVARSEAERRGYAERTRHLVGTLADLGDTVDAADIVTLDKVVCCDPDLESLLAGVTRHARRTIGLVYPRVTWWNRLAARFFAVWGRVTRDRTRWYLHRTARVDGLLHEAGFERRSVTETFIWQVALYVRAEPGPS
ncbi:MAG TPA: methyltransferase domain-containing protein [Candidatus Limnocylindrales bacterium]|nr:methyltransferase domain-containing protein [Candidatus Limnocylindrales bacterium]